MALQEPLTITQGAKTVTLTQLPTKRFFKFVLFIRVPIDITIAQQLGVGYLYTDDKTLRPFSGTIDPLIPPYIGASFTIAGSESQTIITEKVCNFRFTHNDDEEAQLPLVMQFRVHQREPAQDVPVEQIIEESIALQRFLAQLNTSHFGVSVIPRQAALFGPDDLKDTSGMIPMKNIKVDYHNAKSGRKNIIQARVMAGALDDGFVGGWSCEAVGFASPIVAAIQPMIDGPAHTSQHAAFLWAASELLFYCTSLATVNEVEKNAVESVMDWCREINPSLKENAAGEAAADTDRPFIIKKERKPQ